MHLPMNRLPHCCTRFRLLYNLQFIVTVDNDLLIGRRVLDSNRMWSNRIHRHHMANTKLQPNTMTTTTSVTTCSDSTALCVAFIRNNCIFFCCFFFLRFDRGFLLRSFAFSLVGRRRRRFVVTVAFSLFAFQFDQFVKRVIFVSSNADRCTKLCFNWSRSPIPELKSILELLGECGILRSENHLLWRTNNRIPFPRPSLITIKVTWSIGSRNTHALQTKTITPTRSIKSKLKGPAMLFDANRQIAMQRQGNNSGVKPSTSSQF